MDSKRILRRRVALGIATGCALLLLLGYLGRSTSSPLHGVSRGVSIVASPVVSGAGALISPFRDVGDWFTSSLRARSRTGELKAANARLTALQAVYRYQTAELPQLRRELQLARRMKLSKYGPITASVVERTPLTAPVKVTINAGSRSGVKVADPVIGDGGLVGLIVSTGADSAIVQLITDRATSVVADVAADSRVRGILTPDADPSKGLLLSDLPVGVNLTAGGLVATANFADPSAPSRSGSLYPAAIPIGRIAANQNLDMSEPSDSVNVEPVVAIGRIAAVQVLTHR